MGLAYQLAGTVLFVTALVQFVFALVSESPNPHISRHPIFSSRALHYS
jgi:hypothetical protein